MRIALLLLPALVLAGCARSPTEAVEPNDTLAGVACPAGGYVTGFGEDGAPLCGTPPWGGFACPENASIVAFSTEGVPECRVIRTVAPNVTTPTPVTPTTPAPSPYELGLVSEGPVGGGMKSWIVANATPEMEYDDLRWMVGDSHYRQDVASACNARVLIDSTAVRACDSAGVPKTGRDLVEVGDVVSVFGVIAGDVVRVTSTRDGETVFAATIE